MESTLKICRSIWNLALERWKRGGYVQVTVDLVVRAIIKYRSIIALFLLVYGVYARGYENLNKMKNKQSAEGWQQKAKSVGDRRLYSPLNRAPPPPPRMIARINARKRSAYSAGGTGLILCYKEIQLVHTTRGKK
jgi:hypothetical protein